jgi:hypothetical protein
MIVYIKIFCPNFFETFKHHFHFFLKNKLIELELHLSISDTSLLLKKEEHVPYSTHQHFIGLFSSTIPPVFLVRPDPALMLFDRGSPYTIATSPPSTIAATPSIPISIAAPSCAPAPPSPVTSLPLPEAPHTDPIQARPRGQEGQPPRPQNNQGPPVGFCSIVLAHISVHPRTEAWELGQKLDP